MVRTRSDDKAARFLEAALKLFVEQGVQNTSTAEIAREAGTAAGTLFLYYPTKQDLIHALALKIGREQSAYIQSILDPALPARETFRAIWDGSVTWFREHMDAYQFIQQVRDTGLIAPEVAAESNQFFTYYYDAITKGLRVGSIQPYPAEVIGGFLYHDIVAVMNLIRMQPDPAHHDPVTRLGFEIFWNGIKR